MRTNPRQSAVHPLQHVRWFSLPGRREVGCAGSVSSTRPLQYPNVTLLTNALVKRLETDASGREVSGVVVERNGEIEDLFRRYRRGLLRSDQFRRAAVALSE